MEVPFRPFETLPITPPFIVVNNWGMTGGELAIVIEGTREDWPGGARTLTAREPIREPNGTFWFGAELGPAGDQAGDTWIERLRW